MTFRRPAERILSPAARLDEERDLARGQCLTKLDLLRKRYDVAVVDLREFEPGGRIVCFSDAKLDDLDYFTLLPLVNEKQELVKRLKSHLRRLRDEAEVNRRASLSEVDVLREDTNRQFAVLRGEIAALRTMHAHRREGPDLPAPTLKTSNMPPMVMANAPPRRGCHHHF